MSGRQASYMRTHTHKLCNIDTYRYLDIDGPSAAVNPTAPSSGVMKEKSGAEAPLGHMF